MPPILFCVLSYPFTQLGYALFPAAITNGLIAGAFAFCEFIPLSWVGPSGAEHSVDVLYDCTHYALHHTRLPAYLREQKKYHLAHHYKNFDLGFGVTSQ